jgi:peptide/nickel transport system permease protein
LATAAEARIGAQVVSSDHDTLARLAVRRFRRHRLAMGGLVILAIVLLMALFAPVITGYPPETLDLRSIRQAPSAAHPLGTDTLGFDVWSRLVFGSRTSLIVGFGAVAISILIGTTLGVIGGFYGGVPDQIVGRLTDTIMSLPPLLLVIVFVSIVGPSLESVVVVIALLTWPWIARIVRGQYLALRESEFVTAARVVGVRDRGIIVRHLLPNILGPLSVAATYYTAQAILLEASLSFLGLGVKPPTPSWGNMVNLAQDAAVLQLLPWTWVPPALAIALIVLAINFVGDGLRDALDPRSTIRKG